MKKNLFYIALITFTQMLVAGLPAGSTANVEKCPASKEQPTTFVTEKIKRMALPGLRKLTTDKENFSTSASLLISQVPCFLPAPGVYYMVYPETEGNYTIETQIDINDSHKPHPFVASLLALLNYKPKDCSAWFSGCKPTSVTSNDPQTMVVSTQDSLASATIKLRTLVPAEQVETLLQQSRSAKNN